MGNLRQLRFQDILILGHLLETGKFFDTAMSVTIGTAVFDHLLRFGRGELYPFILEEEQGSYLGTLSFPSGSRLARLAHFAPSLSAGAHEADLITLLDDITDAAGHMGTYSITAEVDEDADEIEVFRRANFAIYARQRIWVREPQPLIESENKLVFVPEERRDTVAAYYERFVPAIMRGCEPSMLGATTVYQIMGKSDMTGIVLVTSGVKASLIDIYLDDQNDRVAAIITSALASVGAYYRKTYLRVRTFSGLSESIIEENGFSPVSDQFIMIRHIASRAKHALRHKKLAIENGAIPTVPTTHQSD